MGRLLILALLLFQSSVFAESERIVYHLSGNQAAHYHKTVFNLENLLKDLETSELDELDIILLLQGDSIRLLGSDYGGTAIAQRLDTLREFGVKVEVGYANYQQHRHNMASDNPPQLVPSVFSRIIELQQNGYQYLTP